jgi:hypothetical protein
MRPPSALPAHAVATEPLGGDFDLTPPRAPLVLSITDDIRLEVSLVANQAPA